MSWENILKRGKKLNMDSIVYATADINEAFRGKTFYSRKVGQNPYIGEVIDRFVEAYLFNENLRDPQAHPPQKQRIRSHFTMVVKLLKKNHDLETGLTRLGKENAQYYVFAK